MFQRIKSNAEKYYNSEHINTGKYLEEYDRMKRLLTVLVADEKSLLLFTKLRFQGLIEAFANELLRNEIPFTNELEDEKAILSPLIKKLSVVDQEGFAEAEKREMFSESVDLVFAAFKLGLLKFSVEEVEEVHDNIQMMPDYWIDVPRVASGIGLNIFREKFDRFVECLCGKINFIVGF